MMPESIKSVSPFMVNAFACWFELLMLESIPIAWGMLFILWYNQDAKITIIAPSP
jgi:hypothetical protein